MDSRNHIYSASVSTFFYKVLGGIRATAPGYAKATIAPFVPHSSAAEPAALRSVEASLGTPHGPIVSSWTTRILGPRPLPPPPPPPPSPPASCTGVVATCGMQEEGNCPSCGKVRRHDIGAVWVAFFSRWQRYRVVDRSVSAARMALTSSRSCSPASAPRRQASARAFGTAPRACTTGRAKAASHAASAAPPARAATGRMPRRSSRSSASGRGAALCLPTSHCLAMHAQERRRCWREGRRKRGQ